MCISCNLIFRIVNSTDLFSSSYKYQVISVIRINLWYKYLLNLFFYNSYLYNNFSNILYIYKNKIRIKSYVFADVNVRIFLFFSPNFLVWKMSYILPKLVTLHFLMLFLPKACMVVVSSTADIRSTWCFQNFDTINI